MNYPLHEMNDNHDERGRFASSDASGASHAFVPHHSAGRSETTVMVDTDKLDRAWQSGPDEMYIHPGGRGEIAGRRAGFEKFLATGKPVEASRIYIKPTGAVDFADGRHRFSVLRDKGIKRVAVTLQKRDLKLAAQHLGARVKRIDESLIQPEVIPNVVVLGRFSRHGHEYSLQALRDAARLCNGRMVFFGHFDPKNLMAYRPVEECVGILRNGRVDGDDVRADLHTRPQHPRAAELQEAAADCPETFCLSITAAGPQERQPDGRIVVTKLVEMFTADLVSSGGTTNSLFESHSPSQHERDTTMSTATKSPPSRRYANLLEYASQKRSAVDRTRGVIAGVKILGPESRNGRTYSPAAMAQVAKLAEGISVHLNHDKTSDPPIESKFGMLKNVRLEKDGVRGDLICNMSHPAWEQIAEAAEKFPKTFGLSINAGGNMSHDRSGRPIVTDVDRLNSVDLVSSPATNNGLFESEDDDMTEDDEDVTESRVDVAAILKKLRDTKAFSEDELQYIADSLADDDTESVDRPVVSGGQTANGADDPDRVPVDDPEPDRRSVAKFKKEMGIFSHAGDTGQAAPGGCGPDLDGNGQFAGGRGNVRGSRTGNATAVKMGRISTAESLRADLFSGTGRPRLNREAFRQGVKRQALREAIAGESHAPIPTGADFSRALFSR